MIVNLLPHVNKTNMCKLVCCIYGRLSLAKKRQKIQHKIVTLDSDLKY